MSKSLIKYGLAGLFGTGLAIAGMKLLPSELESSVNEGDITSDRIGDVLIFNAQNNHYFALIGKGYGIYEKAEIKTQDGIPFFYTDEGFYDPWGNFFPK